MIRSRTYGSRESSIAVPLIIGAHVGETSVLTRAALSVASFARDRCWDRKGHLVLTYLRKM
jgi:hypothetical protein